MRIVFFGTPSFAADILSSLIENRFNVVGVISRPDKPQGRSLHPVRGAVRIVAEAHQLPHYQPEKVSSKEFASTLAEFKADLFIVAAYGEIISQQVLDAPALACINVHASLLPKYRGAAPIQRSIINGEKETGISIMHMARKMDAGDIIAQIHIPIGDNTTYGALELEMRVAGAKAIEEVINSFERGRPASQVQEESEVTYAPKIELEDCQVKWDRTAKDLHNLIRGVNPEPGAWCAICIDGKQKRLKIFSTLVREDVSLSIKHCQLDSTKKMVVGCGQGALELIEVQLEGKKRMNAADFYRGLPKANWEME